MWAFQPLTYVDYMCDVESFSVYFMLGTQFQVGKGKGGKNVRIVFSTKNQKKTLQKPFYYVPVSIQ